MVFMKITQFYYPVMNPFEVQPLTWFLVPPIQAPEQK